MRPKSVKRTTEKSDYPAGTISAVRFTDYNSFADRPAMNRWATFSRPLKRGLGSNTFCAKPSALTTVTLSVMNSTQRPGIGNGP